MFNITKIGSHVKKQESMIYSEAWGLLNTNQPQEDKEFRINRLGLVNRYNEYMYICMSIYVFLIVIEV